jgi:predicted nucleic acid-binding protein
MTRKLGMVISNSSPIIGLASLGLLHLLWELFDQVIVTEAVYTEVVIQGRNRLGKEELETSVKDGYIQIYSVVNEGLFINHFIGKLHRGELEVMTAAKELDAQYILIDDKAARVLAEALLLEPTGLVGLLKLAKLTGKIDSLKDCLDRLIENNYRISKKIYNEVLIEVGEIVRNEDK